MLGKRGSFTVFFRILTLDTEVVVILATSVYGQPAQPTALSGGFVLRTAPGITYLSLPILHYAISQNFLA